LHRATGRLKKDPDDPVKYDFALCHIGIDMKQFRHQQIITGQVLKINN
jgi:hypothetical protein